MSERMELSPAIVISGAVVMVRHVSDAMVALTHSPGMVAQLLDEDGNVVMETTDPDVANDWPSVMGTEQTFANMPVPNVYRSGLPQGRVLADILPTMTIGRARAACRDLGILTASASPWREASGKMITKSEVAVLIERCEQHLGLDADGTIGRRLDAVEYAIRELAPRSADAKQ